MWVPLAKQSKAEAVVALELAELVGDEGGAEEHEQGRKWKGDVMRNLMVVSATREMDGDGSMAVISGEVVSACDALRVGARRGEPE